MPKMSAIWRAFHFAAIYYYDARHALELNIMESAAIRDDAPAAPPHIIYEGVLRKYSIYFIYASILEAVMMPKRPAY